MVWSFEKKKIRTVLFGNSIVPFWLGYDCSKVEERKKKEEEVEEEEKDEVELSYLKMLLATWTELARG